MKNINALNVGTLVQSVDSPMNPARVGEIVEVKVSEWGTQYKIRQRAEGNSGNPDWDLAESFITISPSCFEDGNGFATWSVIK